MKVWRRQPRDSFIMHQATRPVSEVFTSGTGNRKVKLGDSPYP